MLFWEFTVCMFLLLSCIDTSRFVLSNDLSHLPLDRSVRKVFVILSTIAMIGANALPIYGFFVMPWWQPIVGFLSAAILCGVFTRQILAGSHWLYLWSIGFSLMAVASFAYFQFT